MVRRTRLRSTYHRRGLEILGRCLARCGGAKITVQGDAAGLSTTGSVTQTEAFDTAIHFHLEDMKAIFDKEGLSADEKLMEVTHYGMRRLRERSKGLGYSWPLTFTAVLVRHGNEWRFHTLHWAMPVD